ncbi:MAG TPA: hypothetical protein VL286_07540 [Rhizomicrobium sp.]|nr:hypothetical protein [Rhizomicrobium sp.]
MSVTPVIRVEPHEILAQPEWFPAEYDIAARRLRFVHCSREVIAKETFLGEGKWDYSALPQVEFVERALIEQFPATHSKPRINFIWHTGFCCSTLIARLLDVPGKTLLIKEPGILLLLADAKRQNAIGPGKAFSPRFAELLFYLLGRPFVSGEQVAIKPTNSCNYILRDAISLTEGKHLFLYSDCRSFLVSIAKKSEYGRQYARKLYVGIVGDGNAQARWPIADVFEMTDLQIASIVWHMQIAEFQRSWPMLAPGQAKSLDCDAFLADPLETLVKIDEFLGLGLGRDRLAGRLASSVFSQHSKAGAMAYSNEDRLADHARIAAELKLVLDEIVPRSYELCKTTPRGMPVGSALVPLQKVYAS